MTPTRILSCVAVALLVAACGATKGGEPSRIAAVPVEVRLDHVYVVLDSTTHQAIAASEFLRTQFAAIQKRTTAVDGGRNWTGLYIQGRLTYVELFTPGSFGPVGKCGIGLNVPVSGAAEELRGRLHAALGDSGSIQLVTGVRDGQPQPWFYSLHARSDSDSWLSRWVMEYHPSFLRWLNLDSPQPDGRVARRVAPRRAYDSTRVFLDVIGVTVALADAEREQFRRELEAYGWNIRTLAPEGGHSFAAKGPDVTITVLPAIGGRSGIRSLAMSLIRPWPGRAVIDFGGASRLTLQDSTFAHWTFF